MLFKEDAADTPQELVLTPRQGGPTPPPPSAAPQTDGEDQPDLPPVPGQRHIPSQPRPSNEPEPVSRSQNRDEPPPEPAPDPIRPASAPVPPASDAASPEQSPNGVKTPQQIYEQLMKLQQQAPKPPAPQ